jgi:hypothetical protein
MPRCQFFFNSVEEYLPARVFRAKFFSKKPKEVRFRLDAFLGADTLRWTSSYLPVAGACRPFCHLELGYKNLFEYCRVRLNLSDGSIWRRTQVAGVCRRFPHLLAALFEGNLNVTDASLIAPHLTSDNADELISAAGRMTNREQILEKALDVALDKKDPMGSLKKNFTF